MINITLNQGCVIQKWGGSQNNKRKTLFGKFIKEYKDFYMFRSQKGYKECFTKNSYGIDWEVIEQ